MPPAISVILPVYNAERYLTTALQSVLDQTLRDFEVIAIDDGSTDGSLAILNSLAAGDERVRVISRPNQGLVATLNEGIEAARGACIARMDADDICMPQRFERQWQRLQAEPGLVAVGSRVLAIDPDDQVLGIEPLPLTHEKIDRAHLDGQSTICHPAVMMRAEAVRAVGGYRELVPVEDFDLWLRLAEVGRLANLDEPLLKYRRSTTGMIARHRHRRTGAIERALHDTWRRRHLPGEPRIPRERLHSAGDLYRQWGWMAYEFGTPGTTRKYAWRALRAKPLDPGAWKLALFAMARRR